MSLFVFHSVFLSFLHSFRCRLSLLISWLACRRLIMRLGLTQHACPLIGLMLFRTRFLTAFVTLTPLNSNCYPPSPSHVYYSLCAHQATVFLPPFSPHINAVSQNYVTSSFIPSMFNTSTPLSPLHNPCRIIQVLIMALTTP